MKNTIKKLGLCVLLATTLIGCSNSNNQESQVSDVQVNSTGFPIVEEQIEMSMIAPGLGLNEWNDMDFIKDYEEKTNIKLNIQNPPQSEFATKLNLAFASGEIPDIIYAGGPNTFNAAAEVDYGQQGLLVPLEDMIEEYAPNFHALMEQNPDIRKSITTTEGHIYALPHITEGPTSQWIMGPVWYNGEWLDNLGVEQLPQSVEEFKELMIRFRDEDPNGNGQQDEIPISDVNFGGIRHWFMPAFGVKGWGVQENDGVVSYSFTDEGFRGYLEFMRDLYAEGLIDQEVFSQSKEQMQAKGQDNRIGVFQEWYSYFLTGRTEEEAINDPMFGPLTSEYQTEPVMPIGPGIKRGAFAISSNNPSPEAALRWIDEFYTKEGFEYLYYGPEGSYWNWADDSQTVKVLSDAAANAENSEEFRGTITPAYGITVPAYSQPLDPIGEVEENPFNDFIVEETQEKILDYGEVIFPLIYLTPEEQEEISYITVELETYMLENEAQFIRGSKELNDETWQEYLDTMSQIGSDRLIEINQEAYDRWNSVE